MVTTRTICFKNQQRCNFYLWFSYDSKRHREQKLLAYTASTK
jgi:hypothetical protein